MPVAPPRLELVAQAPAAAGRQLRFRLHMGGADAILIRLPAEAQASGAGEATLVSPRGTGGAGWPFILRCTGRACDGRTFTVTLGSRAPVEWTVAGTRNSVPPAAAPLLAARPRFARPQYGANVTVAVDRFRF